MEPGFQIYGPHKAEAASPIEHMNDLVTALLIAALFIALGWPNSGPSGPSTTDRWVGRGGRVLWGRW